MVAKKRLKILPVHEAILFPHTESTLTVNSEQFAMAIKKDKAFIVVHTFPEAFKIPEIGTLAVIKSTEPAEGTPLSFKVSYVGRIRLENKGQIRLNPEDKVVWFEAEWKAIVVPPIEESVWFDDGFAEKKGNVETLCRKFIDEIRALTNTAPAVPEDEKEEAEKAMREFLAALKEFEEASRESFHIAIDKICESFMDAHFGLAGRIPKETLLQYRDLLFTVPAEARLVKLEKLAEWYGKNFRKLLDMDGTEAASLIKEELSKPRHPKPRYPPLTEVSPEEFYRILDAEKQSELKKSILDFLTARVIRQERAHEQIARKIVHIKVGKRNPEQPTIGGFFFGPTGVGKTESVKALAEWLLGDPKGYIHVPCHVLQESHQSSYLIGSPPGYVGYKTEPLFSQWKLDRPHVLKKLRESYEDRQSELNTILEQIKQIEGMLNSGGMSFQGMSKQAFYQNLKAITGWKPGKHLAIVLLDELEKAHPDILKLFMRIFDDGILNSMDGETVSFSNAIIFATSNLYGREIANEIAGRTWGIRGDKESTAQEGLQQKLYEETVAAAEKFFLPELLARVGKENIRVFHSLGDEDLLRVLEEKELPELAHYFLETHGIELFVTNRAKAFLVAEVMDKTNRSLGVRALHSVIGQKIEEVMANFLDLGEAGGLVAGDQILIDTEEREGKTKMVFKSKNRSP